MSDCAKCKRPTNRAGQRMCKPCHADNMREWRKTHRLDGESRVRQSARAYARTYLKRGQIEVLPCCVCGSPDAEMHHPDHNRPLHIFWLCRAHHLEWHRVEREQVNVAFEIWLPKGTAPARVDLARGKERAA